MEKIGIEMLMPEEIRKKFELVKVEEKEREWIFDLVEKEDQIPSGAQHRSFGKKIVLNGYKDQLELVHVPIGRKICYLRLKRRRWRISETKETFHNTYNLHPRGLKCTHEFGDFLKGIGRRTRGKFFTAWEGLRHVREKDFSVVSNLKRVLRITKPIPGSFHD